MTGNCSKNITPDSLTGMIFALEGMKNTVVLLNGPMGCKFYHSTTSQFLALHPPLYLPVSEGGEKEPVNNYDYVYGTSEKVREALQYIKEYVEFDVIAVVNAPGASLIGDNLLELVKEILDDRPCVLLESPGYSEDFCNGYDAAVLELLKQVGLPMWHESVGKTGEKDRVKTVNLLGLSIWQRYWEGDVLELKRLFELCKIRVNCCLCAGSTLEELRRLPQADLNVVVYPEHGLSAARFLEEKCGMPFYLCPGPPVGFTATEKMFCEICQLLSSDDTMFRTDSEKARALAWIKIDRVHEMCGLPEGTTFAVEGACSVVYSYTRFFMEYFGMVPDSLSITSGQEPFIMEKLLDLLEDGGAGHPERKEILDTSAELVFGTANTIAALQTHNQVFCGIEIGLPGMGYIDVLPKTQLGIKGSLFLVEQVLNGLMSKI